jgi:hypothetical protein
MNALSLHANYIQEARDVVKLRRSQISFFTAWRDLPYLDLASAIIERGFGHSWWLQSARELKRLPCAKHGALALFLEVLLRTLRAGRKKVCVFNVFSHNEHRNYIQLQDLIRRRPPMALHKPQLVSLQTYVTCVSLPYVL